MIRPATRDDVDAMAAVWLRSALTAYADIFPPDAPKPTQEELRATLDGKRCFVATDGAEVIGVVEATDGWLKHLYVCPSRWRQGFGAALHDVALDALRADGCARASLWVLEQNATARAMYARRGWTLVDQTRPVYEPAGIVDVRYDLVL